MFLNVWRTLVGRLEFRSRQRSRTVRKPRHLRSLLLEQLEDRITPSFIHWVNEGDDNFEIYPDPQVARQIVHQAIHAWEQVIVSFHYADPTMPYSLYIYAKDIQGETLGLSSAIGTTFGISTDNVDRPYQAEIYLDDDANGSGWFFDDTPGDNKEFPAVVDRDVALGGPDLSDFYSTALHEMGHAMGIASGGPLDGHLTISDYLFDAGTGKGSDGKPVDLSVLIPPGYIGPLTTFQHKLLSGIHVYGNPPPYQFAPDPDPTSNYPNAPVDTNDLMNPARSHGERDLISDLDATILYAVYGYDIPKLPSTIAELNFIADLDADTGVLRINGDPEGPVNDHIVLSKQGGLLGVDVGNGPLLFPFASVTGISVQTGQVLDGDDTLTLDFSGGTLVKQAGVELLQYDGGAGVNTLEVLGSTTAQFYALDAGQVTVGNDTFLYELTNVPTLTLKAGGDIDKIRIDNTSGLQELHIDAGLGNDIIDIEHVASGTQAWINAGLGSDTVYLSLLGSNLDGISGSLLLDGITSSLILDGGLGPNDTLTLWDQANDNDKTYTVSGASVEYGDVHHVLNYNNFDSVELDAGTGYDTIYVESVSTATTVDAGFGDESSVIVDSAGSMGDGFHTVDFVQNSLIVKGGAAINHLILNDTGDKSGDIVTVTPTTVGATPGDTFFGPPGGGLTYQGMSTLTLNLGPGGDTVNVEGTAKFTTTSIAAGKGDDTITVSSDGKKGGTVGKVASHLIIDGQDGTDHLIVDDTLAHQPKTVTVTATTIGAGGETFFGQGGHLTYSSVSTLLLSLGSGADTVNVPATGTDMGTTIKAGGGSDRINVGNAAHRLDGIVDTLTIDGGHLGSDDLLTIDDQGAIGILAYTLETSPTLNSVIRSYVSPINYANLDRLVVKASDATNTIQVMGTPDGTSVLVNAGAGSNLSIHVGNAANTLDEIKGALTVDGQKGINDLAINDQGSTTGQNYTFAAGPSGTLTRGSAQITYASMLQVNLFAGLHHDTITLSSILPGALVVIDGGPGAANGLAGPDTANTWHITSNDAGSLGPVSFSSIGSLLGGTAADTFFFSDGVGLSGGIHGNGGADTLAFSAYQPAHPVVVNLTTHTASPVTGAVLEIVSVTGGAGNDVLIGDGNNNILRGGPGNDMLMELFGNGILLGGEGDDTLVGGTGRCILIGGPGSDKLFGGTGDDILIGGTTKHDANDAALMAILSEWTRLLSYSVRVGHIQNGSGWTMGFGLSQATVLDDGVLDEVHGGGGQDWLLVS